jgi:tetratricopeptide (TPR) repeat protein
VRKSPRKKDFSAAGNGSSFRLGIMANQSEDLKAAPWFQRDWFLGAILLLAVLLTYQPVWSAGFIWDDDQHLTANPCIVGPFGLTEIWTTRAADICPLTLTTFWLEHALWGLASGPYHLVNILLHGGGAVLLWRVLRLLRVPGAWFGAALWALHPVEVESVAWITEMKNTESGLLFLLSIFFFLKWQRAGERDERKGTGWNYVWMLLFAAMAMASKASTVILPLVLLLGAWWMQGRCSRRILVRVFPIFFMSLIASAVAMTTVTLHRTTTDAFWARTWLERLITAGDAVWFYVGKLLWPHPLMTIYPRWEIDARDWLSYLPLLAVLIVLSILWLNRASSARPWFFAFAYFLVTLLPVLGLIDHFILRFSLVFDHFQYLASMGPLALLGAGVSRLADVVMPGKPGLPRGLCAGLLLLLGLSSWERSRVYARSDTLWADALSKNPKAWVGYYNFGTELVQEGQIDEAIVQYQKAVELNPNYVEAQNNLGGALAQKGRLDEAILHCQQALTLDPHLADAHNNLGIALAQKGELAASIAQFQQALQLQPDYSDAQRNLAKAQGLLRQVPDAK